MKYLGKVSVKSAPLVLTFLSACIDVVFILSTDCDMLSLKWMLFQAVKRWLIGDTVADIGFGKY